MSLKMTVKEFANYRNISKAMVYKYLESGLLSPAIISQKPLLLDVAEADRQLSMNLGPRYDIDGATERLLLDDSEVDQLLSMDLGPIRDMDSMMGETKEIIEDFVFDLRSVLSEPALRAIAKLALSRDSRPKRKVAAKKRKR